MSIEAILTRHLDSKLFELRSLFTGDDTARSVYTTADVCIAIMPPFAETAIGERLAELRAWFDAFLEQSEITVSENPDNKPREVMLARVHPVKSEIWSARVTSPEETPGIRALCAFVSKDQLVALTWDFREDMDDFDGNVERAIQIWKDLFGTELPLSGDSLDAYLTNFRAI